MSEVFTNQYRLYHGTDLFARVSQCVGVATLSREKGLAHLHYNTTLSVLEELFEKTFDTGEIYLCGGVDAFIPQLGFIAGSRNADRVLEYLVKNNLERYIQKSDVYSDYVRILRVGENYCDIRRVID